MIEKTGVFSVVGRPNVGKSTLTNTLCGAKVAIVSNKPQTTRNRITGVLSQDPYQMVFLDTPGLHKAKNALGDFMVKVVNKTVADVDAAILLVEPVARIGIPEQMLIDRIKGEKMPCILVINKIDTVEKEELLEVMALYGGAHDFTAVIPLSARTGEGKQELLRELEKLCMPSPALFPEEMISDQPERQLVAEIIREKMLQKLDKEVPHGVAVEIEKWQEREDGLVAINAVIYCERKSHKGIIIGKSGAMLKEIGSTARFEIQKLLDDKVAEGQFMLNINTRPTFPNGTGKGTLRIENSPQNRYLMIVKIYRYEDRKQGELLYESGAIKPGNKIETARLKVELPKGEYPVIVYFEGYDEKSRDYVGKAGSELSILIQK